MKKVLLRNDNTFSNKQINYIKKQEFAESMRKKFQDEKNEKARIEEMKRKNKEKEIIEMLKKNEENIKKKLNEYNKKQELILEKK
jgi:hypothetical protein